jgi:hypothetical protein
MKKGYIAGGLFSDAQKRQRVYEKQTLAKEIPDIEFFNPLTDNKANDKSTLPTAKDIYQSDTLEVMKSDYIIAELDGADVGMCFELGQASAINLVREMVTLGKLADMDSDDIIEMLLDTLPQKTILAHHSDIRLDTANQYDRNYIPYGYNQFVIGGIEANGRIFKHFEDIVDYIKNQEHK